MSSITLTCIIRKSLFVLVAVVLLTNAPAWAAWTHEQDVQWPNGPNGCYNPNNNTQCTLGAPPNGFPATKLGSTLVLGVGVQNARACFKNTSEA